MPYPSAFHGRLKELDGVSVDNFTGSALNSRAFFLSHCHMDHMQGLFSHEFKSILIDVPSVKIYMSKHSAAIVRHNIAEMSSVLDKAIQILDLGTTELILPDRDQFSEEYISVTIIPAGHCLGSVMYLFKTSRDQTILYTGDFRIRESDVNKYAQLHSNGAPIHIDALYVDTTFIHPKFEHFPKRGECIEKLVLSIQDWIKRGETYKVALSFSAKYGYEYVIMELYKRLKMSVFVKDKWILYSKMDFIKSAVTNDDSTTRLHECRHIKDGMSHTTCGLTSHGDQFLFVRLSAMTWTHNTTESTAVQIISENRINVCFATHCSRSEIKAFIDYYEPKRIEGFPYSYNVETAVDLSEADLAERLPSPVKSPQAKRMKLKDDKVEKSVIKNLWL